MRTFAVVNQKGGCGKTTTAINLAGVFAGRGYRTLLVDMDPQGHCAAGLAIPEQRVDQHIGDAMLAPDDKPIDPQRLLWRVSRNLDLAPSTVRLAALEAPRGDLAAMPDAESRLKKVLARFDAQYEVCLIDCSPAIGMLAFNALVAADEVLIPVETGFFSLQGATKQINAIKSIGKRLGVAPHHRLLATMHDPSSVLSRDLLEELRRRFGNRVIPVVISMDHALREASSFGQPVVEYRRVDSVGAKDYQQLTDWLIENSLKTGAVSSAGDLARTPGPAGSETGSEIPLVQVIAGIGDNVLSPAASSPATPPLSRAAEMAQRTRRLQRAATISEAKFSPMSDGGTAVEIAPEPARATYSTTPSRDPFASAPITPAVSPPPQPQTAPHSRMAPAFSTAALPPVESPTRLFGIQVMSQGVLFACSR